MNRTRKNGQRKKKDSCGRMELLQEVFAMPREYSHRVLAPPTGTLPMGESGAVDVRGASSKSQRRERL